MSTGLRIRLLAAMAVFFLAVGSAGALTFTNVAGTQLGGSDTGDTFMPIGGGAAWCDINGDGRLDLFLAMTGVNRLFRNEGGDTFLDVTVAAGLGGATDTSHSATCADYDNDGDADLFVGNYGQNRLYRNNGSGSFVDVTMAAGLADPGFNTSSSSWGDFDGDGYLDLAVINHAIPGGTMVEPTCSVNDLWHNNGDGTFTNVAASLGVEKAGPKPGCGLAVTWSDYDTDGDLDLFVVNDFGRAVHPNVLYRNDTTGTSPADWKLTDVSSEARVNYELFGMGICRGDVRNIGRLDYYTTHYGPNKLALADGLGGFDNVAPEAGVEATDTAIYGADGLISWGCDFPDIDRDGWVDLIVANGWIPGHDTLSEQPDYVFRNNTDGTFTETHAALGVDDVQKHRSIAVADYNDDGWPDFYTGSFDGVPVLYRNDGGNSNNYLKVTAEGTIGNRDAIGARIRINAGGMEQQRELHGGNSFLSMSAREALFGLGDRDRVDRVEVTFLSGLKNTLVNVPANGTVHLVEPLVTNTGRVDRANATEDSLVELRNILQNHTDASQSVDLWVTVVTPSEAQINVIGPVSLTLAPRETREFSRTFPVTSSTARGRFLFLNRVGTFPAIDHQSVSVVKVE